MKDRSLPPKTPTGSIPIISPVLHCVSMPVLVFLRRSFGYAYLSPKSVFLASIFATCLFGYAVWHDTALKARYFALAAFGLAASGLYLLHLLSAIVKQVRSGAEHDHYSGSSHLGAVIRSGKETKGESVIHGIAEPLISISVGFLLLPNPLGRALVICGVALALKEAIRAWLSIRVKKRLADSLGDAGEAMANVNPSKDQPLPTKGRTERERLPRNFESEGGPGPD